MEEKKEDRIVIEDLPQAKQELTTEEAKDVKGGVGATCTVKIKEASKASFRPPTD